MLYLTLFEITVIIVLITDISGITDHISQWISNWLTRGKFVTKDIGIQLLTCSFCQNWWVCLFYIIFTHNFTVTNILFILLCSFMTPVIKGILYKVRDVLIFILNKINIK